MSYSLSHIVVTVTAIVEKSTDNALVLLRRCVVKTDVSRTILLRIFHVKTTVCAPLVQKAPRVKAFSKLFATDACH